MITTLMNQKRGLNRLSKLPDDGDPWAQVGNDQEKAQSVKDPHSKNRGGKKLN